MSCGGSESKFEFMSHFLLWFNLLEHDTCRKLFLVVKNRKPNIDCDLRAKVLHRHFHPQRNIDGGDLRIACQFNHPQIGVGFGNGPHEIDGHSRGCQSLDRSGNRLLIPPVVIAKIREDVEVLNRASFTSQEFSGRFQTVRQIESLMGTFERLRIELGRKFGDKVFVDASFRKKRLLRL